MFILLNVISKDQSLWVKKDFESSGIDFVIYFLFVFKSTVSSYFALEYQKRETRRVLKCYAFLTHPAPNISWVQGNTSIRETDREGAPDGVLYSLRSDQNILSTTDPYYCHIRLPHEEWAAEWKMQGRNEWKSLPALLLNVTVGLGAKLNTVLLQWGNTAKGCAFLFETHLLQLQGSICARSKAKRGWLTLL